MPSSRYSMQLSLLISLNPKAEISLSVGLGVDVQSTVGWLQAGKMLGLPVKPLGCQLLFLGDASWGSGCL